MKEIRIKRAKQLIKQIDALYTVDAYVNDRKSRKELASLYKQVMNVGAGYPDRPRTMTNHIPMKLAKKVSRTCPSCVKPDAMKRFVNTALDAIQTYAQVLIKWVNDGAEQEPTKSIHDLRPTK